MSTPRYRPRRGHKGAWVLASLMDLGVHPQYVEALRAAERARLTDRRWGRRPISHKFRSTRLRGGRTGAVNCQPQQLVLARALLVGGPVLKLDQPANLDSSTASELIEDVIAERGLET